jgi:digeranylgeranylglycerophospholipid reductase
MMKDLRDAIVIGGGPAGSSFALELAKRGFDVAVFEEHPEIGFPSHCAGHLSISGLRNLGLYPLPESIVENTFSAANFYSPLGTKFSVHLAKPVTCAVNRARFDKFLAEKAEAAGADFHAGVQVNSLVIQDGSIKGVRVVEKDGAESQLPAKLVVDSEGISSRLLRQAGLQGLEGKKMVYAVEAEVEGVRDVEEHAVEVYVGRDYAPGFYGWLIPRQDGSAKVGLATRKGNPKEFLERLIQKHPIASTQLRTAKVKSTAFHAITLGGPIPKAYAEGFLAVGDCASQVKPTTGGGVIFSITCATIAAEVAAEALKNADLSEDSLRLYQKRFTEAIGFDIGVMLRARRILDGFSDEKIERAVQFASKIGLGEALRDVDEIDFQGRMILSLAKSPTALATLAYLAALSLSTFS